MSTAAIAMMVVAMLVIWAVWPWPSRAWCGTAPSRTAPRRGFRTGNDLRHGGLARGMTTIGLIGSGNIGSAIARLAVAAGYDVVLSNSRGPETLADLVAELGPKARAATAAEAAEAGDLVVVTVPLKAYREVRSSRCAARSSSTPTTTTRSATGRSPSSTTSRRRSASCCRRTCRSRTWSRLQQHFRRAARSRCRALGYPERSVLAIAGDDADAKQTVTGFLDAIGYDAYDVGPLAEGWRYQRDTAAYAVFSQPGRPVKEDWLRKGLDAAVRYRDM